MERKIFLIKIPLSLCTKQIHCFAIYLIKELVQPKMSLNREFLIWKEREGERERGGGRVSR
jgi:hypothetical protein